MNRQIKFRIWDEKLKKIWHGNLRELFGHLPADVKDEHIQQYTGLKDKNGIPIFEGDFVKYNPDDRTIEREGIIEWSNYYHGWAIRDKQCYPESDYGVFSLASPFMSFNDVKIIGNIMQNPELIKKQ